MDHEFWHARWERKEIGFHQESVNHYLHEHWPDLTGPEKVRFWYRCAVNPMICGGFTIAATPFWA